MTTTHTRTWAAALAAGLAALSLAACSSTPTQEDAESAVCTSLDSVRAAVQQVGALNADSTVEEAQAAKDALDESVTGLQDATADLEAADTAAIQTGAAALSAAVDAVSGSDTLAEAATGIQQAGTGLETAVNQIGNGLGCS
jgi:hypothetical protein